MTRKIWMANVLLVVMTILGGSYLTIRIVRILFTILKVIIRVAPDKTMLM